MEFSIERSSRYHISFIKICKIVTRITLDELPVKKTKNTLLTVMFYTKCFSNKSLYIFSECFVCVHVYTHTQYIQTNKYIYIFFFYCIKKISFFFDKDVQWKIWQYWKNCIIVFIIYYCIKKKWLHCILLNLFYGISANVCRRENIKQQYFPPKAIIFQQRCLYIIAFQNKKKL